MSTRFELSSGAPTGLYPWTISGTVAVGDVVAVSAAGARTIERADADTGASRPPIGVVTAISGSAAQVALNGEIATGLSGLTRGASYWLSTTAGQLTATEPGSNKFVVGVALSATELLVSASQADLAGGGGGAGTVSSVAISSSDFTVTGSPVTTSGTIDLALNTVSITKGGTGQATKAAAFDALSPMTTKGDTIVHDGTDNVRLPVGTDGQVLQADSSQTEGVRWVDLGQGTVASVTVSGTGITGGGTVTTSGSLSLSMSALSPSFGGLGTSSTASIGGLPYASSTTTGAVRLTSPTFINRLINGAMAIDQRFGGTAAQCVAATRTYTVDRWYVQPTGGNVTAQQVASAAGAGAPTMPQSLQITGAASVTNVVVGQRIEASNCLDMNNRFLRVSFWAYNNTGSDFSVAVATGAASASDNFTTVNTTNTTNFTLVSGWNRCVVPVFTASSAASNGIQLTFSMGALSASQSVAFTGVQLEVGGQASAFEFRPMGMEEALCYRYYQRMMANATYTTVSFGTGLASSTTNAVIFVKYKTAMRSTPTLGSSVASANLRLSNVSNFAVTAFGATSFGTNTATLNATSTGLTQGAGLRLGSAASASAYIDFSAEL
jgi:hypothetical protein